MVARGTIRCFSRHLIVGILSVCLYVNSTGTTESYELHVVGRVRCVYATGIGEDAMKRDKRGAKSKRNRINEDITGTEVRLIGSDGEQVGILR